MWHRARRSPSARCSATRARAASPRSSPGWSGRPGTRTPGSSPLSLGSAEPSDGTDPMAQAVDTPLRGDRRAVRRRRRQHRRPLLHRLARRRRRRPSPSARWTPPTGRPPFTSGGPRHGDNALKPDLAAPGVDVLAARSGLVPRHRPLHLHERYVHGDPAGRGRRGTARRTAPGLDRRAAEGRADVHLEAPGRLRLPAGRGPGERAGRGARDGHRHRQRRPRLPPLAVRHEPAGHPDRHLHQPVRRTRGVEAVRAGRPGRRRHPRRRHPHRPRPRHRRHHRHR